MTSQASQQAWLFCCENAPKCVRGNKKPFPWPSLGHFAMLSYEALEDCQNPMMVAPRQRRSAPANASRRPRPILIGVLPRSRRNDWMRSVFRKRAQRRAGRQATTPGGSEPPSPAAGARADFAAATDRVSSPPSPNADHQSNATLPLPRSFSAEADEQKAACWVREAEGAGTRMRPVCHAGSLPAGASPRWRLRVWMRYKETEEGGRMLNGHSALAGNSRNPLVGVAPHLNASTVPSSETRTAADRAQYCSRPAKCGSSVRVAPT